MTDILKSEYQEDKHGLMYKKINETRHTEYKLAVICKTRQETPSNLKM